MCYDIGMISKRNIARFLFTFFIMVAPSLSLAAGGLVQIVPDSCNGRGGCQSICDVAQLAQNVLNDGIYFSIVISAVLFAYGGWQYLTAGKETYKIKKARKVFFNVIIGLCIIVAAWLLIDTLLNVLTGGSGLQWNRIC